jgi:ketosteroid isomerase-like protein
VTSAVDEDVLAANAAFYAAFEQGDYDAMGLVWADDDGVVCVHPGAVPIIGRVELMRSWVALMATTPYIQFFLTEVVASTTGNLAVVSCVENVLSAGEHTPLASFAGGSAVATNVFRQAQDGWRLWVHHASPVLSNAGQEGPDGPQEPSHGDGGDPA